MESKHQVHNLIILDESGSMNSIKNSIITGFNEIVQTVKGIEIEFPEQEHFISFITFNGIGKKILHFIDPAVKLEEIDSARYKPEASTPLFDVIGFGVNKLKQHLEHQTDYNVLVTILTDGEENASTEFSGKQINQMIQELKLENWTFTYIGTDHDVDKMANSISINNTISFDKSETGVLYCMSFEKESRKNYSRKIRNKEDTSDYYS